MTDGSNGKHIRVSFAETDGKDVRKPTDTSRQMKAAFRSTRLSKRPAVIEVIQPRKSPTPAEKVKIKKLKKEFVDASFNGLRSTEVRWMAMILEEENSPHVLSCLLDIMLRSPESVLQKLLSERKFLPTMHNWLNLYIKHARLEWDDVQTKIIQLFTILPLPKTDRRDLKTLFKRLSQTGSTEEIRGEAEKLLERWEMLMEAGNVTTPAKKRQLINPFGAATKKQMGKALFAKPQSTGLFKRRKLRQWRPGPLAAHQILRERSLSDASTPTFSEVDSQQRSSQATLLHIDSLPSEASQVVNRVRIDRQRSGKESQTETGLIHSRAIASSDLVFYREQRDLYDRLRIEPTSERLNGVPEMCSQTQWTASLKMEPFSLPNVASAEAATQVDREKHAPAVASGPSFYFIDAGLDVKPDSQPPFSIPYFPQNEEQYGEQQSILLNAGVRHPAHLGREILDYDLTSA